MNFNIINNIINKYGFKVSITPVVKTNSNVEGDETLTDGTSYEETVYLSRRSDDWSFDQAGLIRGGDAVMLVTASSSVDKDYKVLANGVTYRVQDVIDRSQAGGTSMFKTCNLFVISQ